MIKIITPKKFSELVPQYDVFLMDIFGVLHDGEKVSPQTLDLLHHLSALEKHVYLLSNAPQRTQFVIDRLEKFGFKRSLYQHILTAGEQVYEHLKKRPNPWHARLGKNCYFLGDKHMADILTGLDYARVSSVEEADFLLVAGPDAWHKSLEDYEEVLRRAATLSLPMICGNPDLFVFMGEKIEMRAGQLASFYHKLGGDIFYHGKPYSTTYDMVFQDLKNIPKERILAVGDSLVTDIAGANGVGIDSLLVLSLATRKEAKLGRMPLEEVTWERLQKNLEPSQVPTYFMRTLIW